MSLDWLYHLVDEKEREVDRINRQNEKYQQKVNRIEKIYGRMQDAKRKLNVEKNDLSSYSEEVFPLWQGRLHTMTFVNPVQQGLVSGSYSEVIRQVDANMDVLNNAKTDYQNRILRNYGLLGDLAAGINSLWNRIENWFN